MASDTDSYSISQSTIISRQTLQRTLLNLGHSLSDSNSNAPDAANRLESHSGEEVAATAYGDTRGSGINKLGSNDRHRQQKRASDITDSDIDHDIDDNSDISIVNDNVIDRDSQSQKYNKDDDSSIRGSNDDAKNASGNNENDNGDNPEHPNTDPLNIKELALNFDYLMYKINDRIKSLSEVAQQSTFRQKENTESTIMEIDKVIQYYYEITKKLDEINNDFNKVKQINMIIDEFVPRIKELENYFLR